MNPLLLDLILDKIFSHLTSLDLKNCRLVCTTWFKPATLALQKCKTLVSFGALYKANIVQIKADTETIGIFCKAMKSCTILPYVRFDFRPTILSRENLPKVESFLENFGPQIEYLSVNLAFESEDNFSSHCFENIKLTNLQCLEFHMNLRGEQRPSFRTDLETSRHYLLSSFVVAAPNLKSLVFWCDNENLLWPQQAIETLGKCHNLKNSLTSLKVSFPMENNHCLCLKTLTNLNLPLQAFCLVMREPILISPDIICSLLSSFKCSLENLTIIDLQGSYSKPLEIPQLPVLKTLTIEGALCGNNCVVYLNKFSFKKVARLDKIVLKYCYNFNFDFQSLLCDYQHFSKCSQLHVTLDVNGFDSSCVLKSSFLFPCMRILKVDFNSESRFILRHVFQHLKSLEELCINLRKCDVMIDDVFCGLSESDSQRLLGKTNAHAQLDVCVYPSLRDLGGLRKLSLTQESKLKPVISDLSFYLGFKLMPNLKTLIFSQCGYGMTKSCLDEIKKTFDYFTF